MFDKYVIGDNLRPDNVAEELYGSSTLDYIVIISAGITNINHHVIKKNRWKNMRQSSICGRNKGNVQ